MAFCLGQYHKMPQAANEMFEQKFRSSDALTTCFSEGCFAAACEQAESERATACEEIDSVARELECQHLSGCECVSENDECESDFEEEGDIGCEYSSCAYWEAQCGPSGRIGGSGSRRSVYRPVYSTRHIRIIASRKG